MLCHGSGIRPARIGTFEKGLTMFPIQPNLEMWTNADYYEEYTLTANDGLPVDLTGCSFRLEAKVTPTALITAFALGMVADDVQSGIKILEPANGIIRIQIRNGIIASAFAATAKAFVDQQIVLVYDLLIIHPDGIKETMWFGSIVINKGIAS